MFLFILLFSLFVLLKVLTFRGYKQEPDRLIDILQWNGMFDPGVIHQKDGALQKTFEFRGPDLACATRIELITLSYRVNNIFKRLTSGWAIHVEGKRIETNYYPKDTFPDDITQMIDNEREKIFNSGSHFETKYLITLTYLPPPDNQDKLKNMVIQGDVSHKDSVKRRTLYKMHLKDFMVQFDRLFSLFKEIMPEARILDDDETLTYLHSTVSTKNHIVKMPADRHHLDYHIADSNLTGGWNPKLGDQFIGVISVKSFPDKTIPAILDRLNILGFEYRWVTRFIPLDKKDAISETTTFQRKWLGKRKSLLTQMKETASNSESRMVDLDADSKADDAGDASKSVSADYISLGYLTTTVVILDSDKQDLERKLVQVETAINGIGFVTIREKYNAVDAWLGTLPGHARNNVRRPLLSSYNFTHLMPLSAIWAGLGTNKHLNASPLMYTQTSSLTPFRLNLHIDDVGHTFVVGPTGTGKSVLLTIIEAQFRRYKDAKVFIFDKDASSRTLTAGVGGEFYDLADENNMIGLQPLADIDSEVDRAWCSEWVCDIVRAEGMLMTPDIKDKIWNGLCSLANAPVKQRTMTGLSAVVSDIDIRAALMPYTMKGPLGGIFDADHDSLKDGNWQVFEMGQLMQIKSAIIPALTYLFRRLEKRRDGSPQLYVLDECWSFLKESMFADKIEEWLRTLRKFNISVLFATQNLEDILKTDIASAIINACPTKIFLPNPSAADSVNLETYRSIGLNDREIEIISQSTPQKHYYYKSRLGSRRFELGLNAKTSPITLAYVASSQKEDQDLVKDALARCGKEGFNQEWFKIKKLGDFLPSVLPAGNDTD